MIFAKNGAKADPAKSAMYWYDVLGNLQDFATPSVPKQMKISRMQRSFFSPSLTGRRSLRCPVFVGSALTFFSLFFAGCALFQPADSTAVVPRTAKGGTVDPTGRIRALIVDHATELLGTRYHYGGNTPRQGFDCSGMTRYLYQNAGLDLPRVSRDQARLGRLRQTAEARPGDLVFFRKGSPARVFHVSVITEVAAGAVWVVHATSSRGVIRENILASSYWKPKMYQIRDVLN